MIVKNAELADSPWWGEDLDGSRLILAIDSSSRIGSLAVVRGHSIVAEASWTAHGPGGSLHLDLAARLLADHELKLSHLQGIVVATGPGSFTGIRAGISVGQGLAEALSIPLVGVPTLHGIVAQVSGLARPGDLVCAIVGAGRGTIHAWTVVLEQTGESTRFVSCGEFVTTSVEDVALALAILRQATGRRVVIGGELDSGQARICAAAVPRASILSPVETQRRAAWLVGLARPSLHAMWSDVATPDFSSGIRTVSHPEGVQPIYSTSASEGRPTDLGWRVPVHTEIPVDHFAAEAAAEAT